MPSNRILSALTGAALVLASAALSAQTVDSASIAAMKWRQLGPANFEGRSSDVVGIPGPSKTLFVATSGGGIWKSMNNGVTWRPVFDDKRVISMGMLAIAPSDTMQVWAGTGEPNSRNTIEAGAGIYKSVDGGITWNFMGLEKTQHIGRIIVNPRDPNTVYVAALGAAWKSSPDRGLYKTTDGGVTWKNIKFISDKAGFVDVAFDPRDPNVLYAASWERLRTPYSLKSGGPGSGLWKSTDAGATWTEIKGGGFPEGEKGRIGIAVSLSDPNYIYTEVEAAAPQKGGGYIPSRNPEGTGLYRSTDAGKTWERRNTLDTRPFYYSQVRVDPKNRERVYFSSTQIQVSDDGGKTSRPAAQQVHVDDHGMWIDPNDPERFAIANDGGVSITFDKGGNFIQTTNLPVGQFYEISYDMAVPYNVCSGAQDNGAWCGPSRRKAGGTPNAYWYTISGGDGFYTAQDPTDPNIVYGESQGGNASRLNLKTGERMNFAKPSWPERYKWWEDSIAVVRGDPLKAETKPMTAQLNALRAQQKQDSVDLALRFNWNAPYFLSPHNPAVIYFAGNRVLKSMKRGEDFQLISPDLSKKQWAKIDTSITWTGGITIDATGAETFGTIVALMESYVKPGLLIAGTDDGNVWKSPNDGATWENLTTHFPGLPVDSWVSRVEPSHFDTLTFYVTFEDHRVNDFTPYVYATNDGGKSFRSIVNDLPKDGVADFVHVIREDPFNRDLLYVGTSLSVYASIDRGAHWSKFASNLPSVAVYDLKIHPRDHELMAATHGRSLWAVDVAPLEQMNAKTLAASAALFEPKTALQYGEGPTLGAQGNGNAQQYFSVPSPTYGAEISYHLATASSGNVRLFVSDARGDTLATLTGPGTVGTHTVYWNFQGARRVATVMEPLSPSERRDSILKTVRAPMVLDSLKKVGFDTVAIARVRTLLAPGAAPAAFGGRGGGGGGGRGGAENCDHPLTMWETFCPRPGEGAAGGGGGGGFGGRGGAAETANVIKIYGIIGLNAPAGGGRGGGGGGGGRGGAGAGRGAVVASSGEYLVTMSVGGQSYKQVLKVERVSGTDDSGNNFGLTGKEDRQP